MHCLEIGACRANFNLLSEQIPGKIALATMSINCGLTWPSIIIAVDRLDELSLFLLVASRCVS